MKSFIFAIFMAIIITAGCLFYTNRLNNLSTELDDQCITILNSIKEEDFEKAWENTQYLEEFLEEKKVILASFIDHNELDKVETNLEQMKVYIAEEKRSDALANCKSLSALFLHFPKNYKVKIENIL